jgi:hypothetical protein
VVIHDLENATAEPFPTDQPVGPPVVTAAPIMAQRDGHLNKNPIEFALPEAAFCVVSPIEPFDHAPLRGQNRRIHPRGWLRPRAAARKMPTRDRS